MDGPRAPQSHGIGKVMSFSIGQYKIGAGRTYVIAEIGNNHNGSFARAIEMIDRAVEMRSGEHTSELQSLMRISYAVFCLKKKKTESNEHTQSITIQTTALNQ